MTVLEREVWRQSNRMDEETNRIIDPLVLAKGMMAAFMSKNPKPHQNTTLSEPIYRPGDVGEGLREQRDVVCCEIVEGIDYDEITKEGGKGMNKRTFETVWWDGFFEVTDAKWRF